jgi:hypothetical protein
MRSTRPIVSSLRTETTSKLTPTLKRWLEFIADGGERGRMVLQATASGGRAASQLQSLRNAGYVEYCDDPTTRPDRIACVSPKPGRRRLPEHGSKSR